jgi:hypothetical protein
MSRRHAICKMRLRLVLGLMAASVSSYAIGEPAQDTSYDDCRTIVAQHSFMLEARKQCQFRLREDTSDLAYACTNQLNEAHRNLAISFGQEMWKKFRAAHTKAACRAVKDDFYPLIQD